MKIIVLVIAALSAGCSMRMHRAYQRVVAGTTTALYVCDTNQTITALRTDPSSVEANPIQSMMAGDKPTWHVTAATATAGTAITWSIMRLPMNDQEGMWLKDMLITAWAMTEVLAVANNAVLTPRGARCGL